MHDGIDEDGAAAAAMEMPRYVSHKKVWALEIAAVEWATENNRAALSFVEKGYAPIIPAPEVFSRYRPVAGDFYVVYSDGYKSLSPRKAFLEGYRPVERGE